MNKTSNTRWGLALVAVMALAVSVQASGADDAAMSRQIEQLRSELESVRNQNSRSPDVIQTVDASYNTRNVRSFDDTCNQPVTTRTGKLVVGGLIQVWYQYVENDSKGWENGPAVLGASPAPFGNNQTQDNDTFRVRRAQITFDFCVTENISGHMQIDPAAGILGFPNVPSNQAPFYNAGFASMNTAQGAAVAGAACPAGTLCNVGIGNPNNEIIRNGGCNPCKLLQEAYINYHDICFMPCHDISIGQMKRRLGEEGYRNDGELDFAERSMITRIADDYDLGAQIHGSFFCDRLQYWAGIFDGAGTAFQSRANRADDNDRKDFLGSIMGRPVWGDQLWGSLELGYSGVFGQGGESGGNDGISNPSTGLNRAKTWHSNQYAWLYYAPGGCFRGLWTRGEYGWYTDRFAPGEVATGLFNYTNNPSPINIHGWYAAAGYRLGESAFAGSLGSWAHPIEFTYRHEQMENLFYQNLVDTNRKIDSDETRVDTVGVNYYIKGHNAKIQLNYNFVREAHNNNNGDRQVREVRNDNLVVNFQVMF